MTSRKNQVFATLIVALLGMIAFKSMVFWDSMHQQKIFSIGDCCSDSLTPFGLITETLSIYLAIALTLTSLFSIFWMPGLARKIALVCFCLVTIFLSRLSLLFE